MSVIVVVGAITGVVLLVEAEGAPSQRATRPRRTGSAPPPGPDTTTAARARSGVTLVALVIIAGAALAVALGAGLVVANALLQRAVES